MITISNPLITKNEIRAKEVMIEQKFGVYLDVFHVIAFADGKFIKLDFGSRSMRYGNWVPPEKQEGTGWEKELKLNERNYG